MKIALFYKFENKEIIDLINKEAKKYGFEIDNVNPDVVFAIGGDGTFLRTVHKYVEAGKDVKFVGINNGSLAFFYEFTKTDIPEVMKCLANGDYVVEEHQLMKGTAKFANEEISFYSVNEVRIENPIHTLICDVSINDEVLEKYRSNGLIVASSLGSSAYNKSLGGALVDNDLDTLQITEVAGIQNNIFRSLGSSFIVKGDKTITFKGELNNTVVGYDHLNIHKDNLEEIRISYSDKTIKIIHSKNYSYIHKIRKSFVL